MNFTLDTTLPRICRRLPKSKVLKREAQHSLFTEKPPSLPHRDDEYKDDNNALTEGSALNDDSVEDLSSMVVERVLAPRME